MKKNILIIQSPVRLNINEWLKLDDFNILAANDGISGLLMAKKFSIDLIIAEINLPKLNDLHFFRNYEEIQQLPKFLSSFSPRKQIAIVSKKRNN